MRYVNILSDGAAKTYQHLVELKAYSRRIKITKKECIFHLSKRSGTGRHNKIKKWRSKGKTLGGSKEGSLKEDTIIKLKFLFRKAIHDNVPHAEKMN